MGKKKQNAFDYLMADFGKTISFFIYVLIIYVTVSVSRFVLELPFF